MKTVVVGLSGGVDSSVSALLLKEQGYRVIGMFMRNWEEEGNCTAAADYEDALHVASALDIPIYPVNFTQEYWDRVFSVCVTQYQAGLTPNPDILCNKEIKFRLFFEKAMELGADFLATGHYCRILHESGTFFLGRGSDSNKDQSYFLYTLQAEQLSRILFPVGHLQKSEVRAIADRAGLITAQKRDSTGICFIGKRNFKSFLSQFLPKEPGEFHTLDGQCVGHHDGIAYYTLGQRKGLHIGGAGEAWYVVDKDPKTRVIVVAQGEEHPALYKNSLEAIEPSWVGAPPQFPLACTAKVRYRSADASCRVSSLSSGRLHVIFDQPQKAITPHQAIVFYKGEHCLGGATIAAAELRSP